MYWTDYKGTKHTQNAVDPESLVLSLGIYANGTYKFNWVLPEHLEAHIQYNLEYRPGRALVVADEIKNSGYMSEEAVRAWLQEHPEVTNMKPPQFPTLPYR